MRHDSDHFASLDDAWEMYLDGDVEGATTAALAVLQADSGSPEAHGLLGTIKASLGHAEDALAHYETALRNDDLFLEAFINAADVLIQLGRFGEALARLEGAKDLATTDDQLAEVLLLEIDALAALGRDEEAQSRLADMPSGPFEAPQIDFLIGRACLQAGEYERGRALLEEASAIGVEDPDLHYYVAMAREACGDYGGATVAFLQCRERDMQAPPPPWSEAPDAFERRVQGLLSKLPDALSGELDGALVIVAEFPGVEMVAEGLDPRAPAMMDEIRLRDTDQTLRRLFVYQRNIDRFAAGGQGVDEEIERTLAREIEAFLRMQKAHPQH